MGTTYSIKIAESNNIEEINLLEAKIDSILNHVNQLFSTYLPDSEISKVWGSKLLEVNKWELNDNKEMIFKNPMTPSKQGFSAAALFGRPELTQGQRIK